jgi:hypothetical protein
LPTKLTEVEIRRVDGAPQWALGIRDHLTWVEAVVTTEQWRGYYFRVEFDAGAELRSFCIHREVGTAQPLMQVTLRNVPLKVVEQWARRWVAEFVEIWNTDNPHVPLKGLASEFTPEREAELARVADSYARHFGPAGWRADVARDVGYSMETIPGLIRDARKAGILPPTTRGRGGGSLTRKGLALLGRPEAEPLWNRLTPKERKAVVARDKRLTKATERLAARELSQEQFDAILRKELGNG